MLEDIGAGDGVPTKCERCGKSGTPRQQFEHMGVVICYICADERVDELRLERTWLALRRHWRWSPPKSHAHSTEVTSSDHVHTHFDVISIDIENAYFKVFGVHESPQTSADQILKSP